MLCVPFLNVHVRQSPMHACIFFVFSAGVVDTCRLGQRTDRKQADAPTRSTWTCQALGLVAPSYSHTVRSTHCPAYSAHITKNGKQSQAPGAGPGGGVPRRRHAQSGH